MLRGPGTSRRAVRAVLAALAAGAILVTGLAGCGGRDGEPSSLDDVPPGPRDSEPSDRGTPDAGDHDPDSDPDSDPDRDPDRDPGRQPGAADPSTGTSPGTRQIVVSCARVRLDLPPSWGMVDHDGLWTFTPPGAGHGRLMVRGETRRVDGPPDRERLEQLAGQGGTAQVRSDGSMFGLGRTKDGDPTWRIAAGAQDRTQLVILTYAATQDAPDRDAPTFRADVDQLHRTVATLQLGRPGDCPGVT